MKIIKNFFLQKEKSFFLNTLYKKIIDKVFIDSSAAKGPTTSDAGKIKKQNIERFFKKLSTLFMTIVFPCI
jgi:hypothetical protein